MGPPQAIFYLVFRAVLAIPANVVVDNNDNNGDGGEGKRVTFAMCVERPLAAPQPSKTIWQRSMVKGH